MGRNPFVPTRKVLSAKALDTSFNTDGEEVVQLDSVWFGMVYTTLTGTGEFKLQGGVLDQSSTANSVQWFDLDADAITIDGAVSTSGNEAFNVFDVGAAEYIRVVYTKGTASAGTVDVYVSKTTRGA